jgi:hypothetical protein
MRGLPFGRVGAAVVDLPVKLADQLLNEPLRFVVRKCKSTYSLEMLSKLADLVNVVPAC